MSRAVAFEVLRQVSSEGGYANLALKKRLRQANLSARDAALVTELVSGTCRLLGTYDQIISRAAGRSLKSLQPAVLDLLRMGAHQLLSMRTPAHAAVGATVELARKRIGNRVTGLVNAILRKVASRDLDQWCDLLAEGKQGVEAAAIRGHHPVWVAEALAEVLPEGELAAALAANNVSPAPTLVVRPGLCEVEELGSPTRFSPFGARSTAVPSDIAAVREGRAGVQDEGSQLVALALARADAPSGPWLDMCAGPGGKSALLAGLARRAGERLIASELQEHRAHLVAQALACYGHSDVIVADGRTPPWRPASFARVLADVPCTGLGALRRRPEARWRRQPDDLASLVSVQRQLLRTAIAAAVPGGVVAYVTCSPLRAETHAIVESCLTDVEVLNAPALLPEVPDCAVGNYVQLWPHRHETDAMFLALLRRR